MGRSPDPDPAPPHERNEPPRRPDSAVDGRRDETPGTAAGETDRPQTLPSDCHPQAAGRERRLAPSHGGERRAQQTPQARSIGRDHHRSVAGRIDKRDRPSIWGEGRLRRMTTQEHVGTDQARGARSRRNQLKPVPVRHRQLPVASRERPPKPVTRTHRSPPPQPPTRKLSSESTTLTRDTPPGSDWTAR